jgi:hypothetical protein
VAQAERVACTSERWYKAQKFMTDRDRYLTIRASAYELDMVKALAAREDLTASEFLRFLIRRTYAEAFETGKPRAKPKPKATRK